MIYTIFKMEGIVRQRRRTRVSLSNPIDNYMIMAARKEHEK